MLGAHADRWFAAMQRERTHVVGPNGLAGQCAFPDRGDKGTMANCRVKGHLEVPGPQNMYSGNSMMPGMGGQMMPGMGGQMMPGMGEVMGMATGPLLIAAAAVIGWFVLSRKKARAA